MSEDGERERGREGSLVSRTMHTKGEGRGRSMLIILHVNYRSLSFYLNETA